MSISPLSRPRWCGVVLVALCMLLASSAQAATYYVAPPPGGSDASTGTAASPWATLQHAADNVGAGDEVIVADGSYAGFELTTSGTAMARITFWAEGSDAVIDAPGPTGDGIRLQNVSYVTIDGFRIVGVPERGIAHRGAMPTAPSYGLIIRGNTIAGSGTEGMYLSEVADSLVEHNTITNAGASGADRTHGIYLANAGSDGTTLRGNVISGSGTAGIHFNGDLSVGGDGIISDLVVAANFLFDNDQNGLNMDGVQDSLIHNNVIYGNASNGIRAYAIDAAEGPRGLVIVNNTFHVPAGAGWCVRITEDLGSNVVFNNILMNDDPSNGSIALDITSGFASDHNVVVDRFTPDRDNTILSLGGWQALGYDLGSIVATPAALFVDVAGADYRLLEGAPAVDFGLDMFQGFAAPATDILGIARPVGAAVDVGAYERCAAGSCLTIGTDGGTGSDGGTAGSDAGAVGSDAGNGGNGDGGCGCRLGGAPSAVGASWVLLLAVFGWVLSRRR